MVNLIGYVFLLVIGLLNLAHSFVAFTFGVDYNLFIISANFLVGLFCVTVSCLLIKEY